MARSLIYTNSFSWEGLFSGDYTVVVATDSIFAMHKTINGVECGVTYVGSALLSNNPVIDHVSVTNPETGAPLARIQRYYNEGDPSITRSVGELQSGGLDSFTHLMASAYRGFQIGSDQADVMISYANADDVSGRSGNDTLISSVGDDVLSGDEGFDYGSYQTAGSGVYLSINDWPDRNTGEAYGDRLYSVEGLIGSAHNDHFIGDQYANHLLGGAGNDTLRGNRWSVIDPVDSGEDTLDGGSGIDTAEFLFARNLYDIVDAGGGYWRVSNRTEDRDAALVINIEFLQFADQRIAAPTGPTPIYGTFGADMLTGTPSVDTIYGSSGNDTLYGGAEADIIHGDADNDRLYGEADNDKLYGDGGNDILDGGAGMDTLWGGAGNDSYILNDSDRIEEAADEGIDTVHSTRNSYTLGEHLENLTLLGTGITGNGNGLNNHIIGNDAVNFLHGDGGNDTLDGGAGADNLSGGEGDDTYIVDTGNDAIMETLNDSIDTVRSSVTYTLVELVENLVLTGTGAVSGTGNISANIITGNDASNTIDGAGGYDTLRGGEGEDTYIIYGNEKIEEAAGGGTDTIIFKGGEYTLGGGVSVELLKANPDDVWGNLTGNELGNKFYGNKGKNTINGGGGDDTLVLSGAQSDYTIAQNDDGSFTITNKNDGGDSDTISNVEILEFSGGKKVTPESLFPPSDIRLDGDVVIENTKTGSPVGELKAIDNSPDTHRFELIDDARGRFGLETVNGVTRLMVKDGVRLDYEQANRHSIMVKVTDGSGGTVTRTLNVQIQDSFSETATGSAGADLIMGGNGRDTFSGGAGNDTLSAGAGNDRLTGNDGNDRLVGGLGQDSLTGSKGRDVFVFDDRETGSSKTKADYIIDFKGREGDRLDLKEVDANTKKSGDQKFSFIGTKAFSKAGEVRYEKTKSATYVYLNTDTDKSAEAVIKLKGSIDLSKSWFVL